MTRGLPVLPLLALAILAASAPIARADESPSTQPAVHVDHRDLLKLSWQLAAIGSTFSDRSLSNEIDLLHSMGIHHVEISLGQIPPSDLDASTALMTMLKTHHMDAVSFGVVDMGNAEADARRIFDLGKRLKIKTIVSNPSGGSLEMLDRLANEFQINVAIVNLDNSGQHWDPKAMLEMLEGRSARMGISADLAAWRKTGVSPLDAVKVLAGHILQVRITTFDDPEEAATLAELKQQKFKGICAVGCNNSPADTAIDRFTKTVNHFSEIVGDISGQQ